MRAVAALLGLVLSVSAAFGQTGDANRNGELYRIEMLVFAWDDNDSASGERWILPESLSYPARLVQLQAPDSSQAGAAPLATGAPAPVAVEPFTPLPATGHKLARAAERLSRQGGMRVLMHKAWLQPLFPRNRADALLVTGGDRVGSHYELEGYVTFSVERYLHLETNLWLSRFSLREPGDHGWPLLPPLPYPQQPDQQPAAGDSWFGGAGDFQQLLSDPYRTDNIFVLHERRRLRSGELHYLDHPRFGALVRIEPRAAPKTASSESGNSSANQ